MNTTGIFLGLFTAIAIGIGFVWVIKLEYYVGAHTAKAVAALGIAIILVSLLIPDFTFSAIVGVLGGTGTPVEFETSSMYSGSLVRSSFRTPRSLRLTSNSSMGVLPTRSPTPSAVPCTRVAPD